MKPSSIVQDNNFVKALVVDDEEKLVGHLKRGLELEGYMVDYCLNGEDAQKFIQLNHEILDIIILDQMLPLKSGVEVCKNIRNKNIFTPVIMLTAKNTEEDTVFGLDAGVDDYVTKPFSFEVLLARMRALLRRPKAISHTVQEIQISNLNLNTATRKVFCSGKEIALTLKEFNLLEYFMKHPNKVIEREELLEKIWDVNFDSFSNVIDVHIRNLRKKLREVHHEAILESVRGVGYRIKA